MAADARNAPTASEKPFMSTTGNSLKRDSVHYLNVGELVAMMKGATKGKERVEGWLCSQVRAMIVAEDLHSPFINAS
jgi:hypothetical protein